MPITILLLILCYTTINLLTTIITTIITITTTSEIRGRGGVGIQVLKARQSWQSGSPPLRLARANRPLWSSKCILPRSLQHVTECLLRLLGPETPPNAFCHASTTCGRISGPQTPPKAFVMPQLKRANSLFGLQNTTILSSTPPPHPHHTPHHTYLFCHASTTWQNAF